MKILITGDIHGNLPALEQLLKLEKGNYDQLVCHGDVVNYAPWSNECVQLLDIQDNAVLLKGNHEDNYIRQSYLGSNLVAQTFFKTCFNSFTEFEKIETYKTKVFIDDFSVRHTIENTYVYPDTDLSKLNITKNYIIGHSHYAFNRVYNNYRVINTGSLGQNRVHINVSNYAVYNTETREIELKSFTNNVDLVIQEMEARRYPKLCLDYYKNKKRL